MKTVYFYILLFSPALASSALAQPPFPYPQQSYPAPYQYQNPYQQMPPQYFPSRQLAYPEQLQPLIQQPVHQQQAFPQQKPFKEFSGYLGLITDIVPSSVLAQLPKGVTQGVLFKDFSSNSPARSSDLKPFDVMFSYNEIPLHHPAQLIKLIRNDEPGKIAKIKVVRKGQIIEIPITVGSQKTPNPKDVNGLEIKQIGKDRFKAIIHFLGPNGNKQLRSFQGSRDDIFDEVLNTTGLPYTERQQLLYAMQPRRGSTNGFGSFFPFGNNGNKDWKFMNPSKYFKW